MKTNFCMWLLMGMFFIPIIAQGNTLFVGGGYYTPITTDFSSGGAFLHSVSMEFDSGVSDTVFPTVMMGTYSHEHNRVYFGSGGFAFRTQGLGWYTQSDIGLAYLHKTTERHATHAQFFVTLFLGYRTKTSNMRIGWEHLSNGANVIDTPKPNHAEDFITLRMSIPFSLPQ